MFRKIFAKKILFAYENYEGDKGIIIATSKEEAIKIFKKEYPKRKIAENDQDYYNNGTYLFEVGAVNNHELYCAFPW